MSNGPLPCYVRYDWLQNPRMVFPSVACRYGRNKSRSSPTKDPRHECRQNAPRSRHLCASALSRTYARKSSYSGFFWRGEADRSCGGQWLARCKRPTRWPARQPMRSTGFVTRALSKLRHLERRLNAWDRHSPVRPSYYEVRWKGFTQVVTTAVVAYSPRRPAVLTVVSVIEVYVIRA